MQTHSFSQGKVPHKNEDYFDYNAHSFVISDGATDKCGRLYTDKSGGEIISRLAVKEALNTNLNGPELVKHINQAVVRLYKQLDIIELTHDPSCRFTCGMIAVRQTNTTIIITYIGDLGFRINGQHLYQEVKTVDLENANARKKFIEKTGDVQASRAHILPQIIKQLKFQNNSKAALGYGVIDGTDTPTQFVKTFKYSRSEVDTIELFTDGYFAIPPEVSIKAWEQSHQHVEKIDPHKCKRYPSTKSSDDRTIAITSFR